MLKNLLLKKVISYILAVFLSFCVFYAPVFASNNEMDFFTKHGLDRETLTYVSPEAIPISDYIIVTMENEYSFPAEDYSPDFFGSEYVNSVRATITFVPDIGIDPSLFHRIEILYLTEFGKQNIDLFIQKLNDRTEILVAERGYITKNASDMISPNDTYYPDQYALSNIMCNKAWAITKGSSSIRVGVLDSGIRYTHEDLSSNYDFSYSTNFVSYENSLFDEFVHGTPVAGIIGARGNNNTGISGVCWYTKLVNLRVADNDDEITPERVLDAIQYANTNNIKILNMSFHLDSGNIALYFALNSFPGIIVVSAGNDSSTNLKPPASYHLSTMIVVASTDSYDYLWFTSNHNKHKVDLAAPGVAVYSTYPPTTYASGGITGTSFAAPFVTGTLALMRSVNSTDSYSLLKQWLLDSVDVFDYLSNDVKSSGRLNTFRAVRKAKGYLMGDADLDHSITPEDARQVLRWAVGPDSPTDLNEALCDVDYSNALEPSDSRLILRMAVGIDSQIE